MRDGSKGQGELLVVKGGVEGRLQDVGTSPKLASSPSFKRLFDAAPALISIHEGPEHVYIYTNPAHDRVVRSRPLLGVDFRTAFPELEGLGNIDTFNEVFRTGVATEVPQAEVVIEFGPENKVRRHFRQIVQPWHDEAGEIAGVMNFSFDVTEQVEARMRAEDSERHMSYALKASGSVGTFHWDTKSDLMTVDEAFVIAFGFSKFQPREKLPLKAFTDVIHPEDRERVLIAIQHAVDTGEHYEEQYRTLDEEGVVRHILAQGKCVRDAKGEPDRFTGVIIDTTRQRQADEVLRESEARLRSIFTSIDKGYCLAEIMLDECGDPVDYRFLEVNPLFEQMTGLKDAAGRTALELVPELEKKWVETYARAALQGETLRFEETSDVMGRHFDVFAMPTQSRGRFVIVFKDITEQKRTEDALRQSEAQFRSITEAMPQMVWATRPDGHHDFFNARWYEFTGVPEGSTDGAGWNDIFHPEDQERAMRKWQHCLSSGNIYDIEYRLRHHSGAYRWVLGRAQPVRDSDGTIVRWLGTCTDIHEIKLADEQRELMLGEMNHRVKNMLSMVHAMVSQTLRQAENLKDASTSIQSRIGNMAQAHDRLINSKWSETRILAVVEAALAPHRSGNGRFTLEGPDIPIGSKQALALTMALHELATNATKYGALSTEDGRVNIRWGVDKTGDDETFNFSWVESDGPPVTTPQRRGFGSRMIEQALAGYFNGHAELNYHLEGLSFDLKAPFSGLKV
ncbi:PAS domain S-box protein [Sulfitobacter sp. F26169L]|uniref:PAS domain-containing sensor histidine kinase n=1 Tax=Sulfitobacter sp. F26169L TaxID=2996015 RepID=UPI002260E8F9|nr:PAS domain S-box protein [Sulfitobacter sp. F26169L]MCX7568190.1 PAS domain S-box protein [Sulfitobacter sp. F26169L]